MSDEAKKHQLPMIARWCVMLAFGGVTTYMISSATEPGIQRSDLLIFASGVGCIASALLWFFIVALQRSLWWSIILLVPLLNTLVLPIFVRYYWGEGTRFPAFLALVGIAGEMIGALRLMVGTTPSLV